MSWPPHITVACIIEKIIEQDRKFLLVEEICNGENVLNQPAGHLEPNESLQQAAVRETYEETGWHVEPTHVLGISRYISPHNNVVYYRTTFIANALQHDANATLDEGIVATHWLSYEELQAQTHKLRSPLVLRNIEQYLQGHRYPLSMIDDAF